MSDPVNLDPDELDGDPEQALWWWTTRRVDDDEVQSPSRNR
jgi:hypothetical protein